MKTPRLSVILRHTAIIVLVLGLAAWIAAGARLGWTQTSVVSMQRDEITGIDFPVRRTAFIPGIEVPLLALAVAGTLAGLSWAAARRAAAANA